MSGRRFSLIAFLIIGCQQNSSQTKEISTDLYGSKVYYFKGEEADIVRTECASIETCFRGNATTNPVRIAQLSLKEQVDSEIRRQAKILSDGIKANEKDNTQAQAEAATSRTASALMTKELAALQSQLQLAAEELRAYDVQNGPTMLSLQNEIERASAAQFNSPTDVEIKKSIAYMEKLLLPLTTKRSELQTNVSEFNDPAKGKIPAKQSQLAAENASNQKLSAKILETDAKLKEARLSHANVLKQLDHIDPLLARIRQGVRFAAASDSDQLLDLREILGIVNVEFDKKASESIRPR